VFAVLLVIAPSSQELGPPVNPERFKLLIIAFADGGFAIDFPRAFRETMLPVAGAQFVPYLEYRLKIAEAIGEIVSRHGLPIASV
jgi:hypothetical protein